MLSKTKRTLANNRTLAFVSIANLVNNIVSIVSGIVVARWLLPEELGVFNALSIFTSYIILAQIGIPSGLSRELPFYFGKNDSEKAYTLASTAKFFLMLLSLIVLGICILISFYFLLIGNYKYAAGTVVIGATSFQGIFITKYLKTLYRSNNHFVKLSRIALIESFVTLLSLILVYKFLFYGLCLRTVILVVVDGYFSNRWKPMDVNGKFNWNNFKELSKVGLPMYLVSNIYGLWPTFQRTYVLSVLGSKGLGIYALANIVQSMLSAFNNSISSMSFPLMSKALGEKKSIKKILLIPFKQFLISIVLYSIILVIGWPTLPIIVNWLLPNYAEGIEAAQWMFIVALISSFGVFSNIFLVIRRNHHRLVGFAIGILTWFMYLSFHSNWEISHLVVFTQAVLIGTICVTISDMIFYLVYLKKESNNLLL